MSEDKSALEQIKAGLEDAKAYKAGDTSRARVIPVPTEELKPLPCPFEEWFDTRYPPEHGSVTAANVRRMFHDVCKEAWDAALTRSPAWRDIESAPRDGGYILVLPALFRVPLVVSWSQEQAFWRVPMTNMATPYEPTHWMPLPLPPEEKA